MGEELLVSEKERQLDADPRPGLAGAKSLWDGVIAYRCLRKGTSGLGRS